MAWIRTSGLRLVFVCLLLAAASRGAYSQADSKADPQPGDSIRNYAASRDAAPLDGNPIPPAIGATPSAHSFPDGKRQLRNYMDSILGPVAFVRAGIGAGLDQSKAAPPEWDSGAAGFGERYGFRFGMHMIASTAEYSEGALLHEDVAYHRCACAGFLPRTSHALLSTFTARTRSGGAILSIPAISSAYAGSFAAVNAWYPARYEPEDAFRLGTVSFGFRMGANLVREYLLPAR